MTSSSRQTPPWLWHLALFLLIGIGVARIVSTYPVFNQTWDEGAHLACGIQWLDEGRYDYEPKHPPLTRIFMALGPYLDGSRSHHTPVDWIAENDKILYAGNYWRTLTLARVGMLPFFILTCLIVWFWTKHLFGKPAALVAVLLVTNTPPLLGHAALATMDIGVPATLGAALYVITRYLESPTLRLAVVSGLAIAATVVTKFSSLAFLPVAVAAFLLIRMAWNWRFAQRNPRIPWSHLAFALPVFAVACWSIYRFSWDPVIQPQKDFAVELKSTRLERLPHFVVAVLERPLPGGQILRGLGSLYLNNAKGLPSYLFSEYREKGWWYFFEVVLAVKTPLAFLILSGLGAVLLIRKSWRAEGRVYALAPLVFTCGILLFCMASSINLGVRHVLIVYPLLSVVAAYGVTEWWGKGSGYRYAVAALIAWKLASSVFAHPDYMAYFNELAGSRPERILLESDLDWGQDLHRASIRLKDLGARNVAVSYFGTARLNELPAPQELTSCDQHADWALVSFRMLAEWKRKTEDAQASSLYSCFGSRAGEKIGKSMWLYRLNPAPDSATVQK